MKLMMIIFCTLFLFGCRQYYHKYNGSTGYSDISYNNIYEISFIGDEYLTQTDVKYLAMVRASEICDSSNFKYFSITEETPGNEKMIIKNKVQITKQETSDSVGNKKVVEVYPEENTIIKLRPTIRIKGYFANDSSANYINAKNFLNKAIQKGIK